VLTLYKDVTNDYDSILQNVLQLMKDKGMKSKQINTILIENPKKLLTFE